MDGVGPFTKDQYEGFLLYLRGRLLSDKGDRQVRSRLHPRVYDDFSDMHRKLCWNVPTVDLDELAIEFGWLHVEGDNFKAVALIEAKGWKEDPPGAFQRAVLEDFVRPGLPIFVVRYDKAPWKFEVYALNEAARITLEPYYEASWTTLHWA